MTGVLKYRVPHGSQSCVFITAGPITKLFAGGEDLAKTVLLAT